MNPAVSVVVISHNYAEYVGRAIDSVLAQDSPPEEILVVDDGSTDGSPEVIRGYGDRVRAVFKANGGNSSVVNAAVPLTRGDLVMFLDADDTLAPGAVARVRAAWRPGVAKVQFRLTLVDADGRRQGVDPPAHVALPDGDVLVDLTRYGRYITPVTSGNAFSRTALDQVLPIPEEEFRNTNDGYLNPMLAFCGPVVSIDAELGAYRMHGRNLWAFSGAVTLERLHERLRHDLARQRHLLAAARAYGRPLPRQVMLRSAEHVLVRAGSRRWDRAAHPVPDDRWGLLLLAGARAIPRDPELSPARKLFTFAVLLTQAAAPRPLARRALTAALSSTPKPAWVRAAARLLRR